GRTGTPNEPTASRRPYESTHRPPTSPNRGYRAMSLGDARTASRYLPQQKGCGKRPRLLACPFCCGRGNRESRPDSLNVEPAGGSMRTAVHSCTVVDNPVDTSASVPSSRDVTLASVRRKDARRPLGRRTVTVRTRGGEPARVRP